MCQSDCREKHPCGAQNPTRVNTTSTASPTQPTASSTSGVAYKGLGGEASPTDGPDSEKSGALAALQSTSGCLSLVIHIAFFAGLAMFL